MVRREVQAALVSAGAGAVVFAVCVFEPRPPVGLAARLSAEARSAEQSVRQAGSLFANGDLARAHRLASRIVSERSSSADKDTQDAVTKARMTLGYIAAAQKDWKTAEATFQAAATGYKGTGAASPDYGRIDDQAAYQAAVTVQASGDKAGAIKSLCAFVAQRPRSPLVFAAHDRLVRLDPRHTAVYDAALDRATAVQQDQAAKEAVDCGPKVVAELLRRSGRPVPPVDELRKECATGNKGTTLDGLAHALSAHGWNATGRLLNKEDFSRIVPPAVLLERGHYCLVTANDGDRLTLYDPLYRSDTLIDVTKLDTTKFTATVLTLEPKRS